MKEEVPSESESVQDLILSCYKDYDCYLLPSPGDKVVRDSNYNGNATG